MAIETLQKPTDASARSIDVIVVDDDDDTREMIGMILSENRCSVRLASNAQEALDAVAERVPDVLVTDLELRDGVSGRGIAEKLRGDDKTVGVARIAFTGASPRADAVRAFDACLRKPLDVDVLVELVQQFTDAGRGRSTKG